MKKIFNSIKLLATIGLIWYIFSRFDVVALLHQFNGWQIFGGVSVAILGTMLQLYIATARFEACLCMLGHKLGKPHSWNACQLGGLLNHTPLSFVGGDVVRVFYINKFSISLKDGTKAVIIDRYLGFIGMLFWVIVTSPFMFEAIKDERLKIGYYLFLSIAIVGAVGFLFLSTIATFQKFSGYLAHLFDILLAARYLVSHRKNAISPIIMSIVMVATMICTIWLIGCTYGLNVSPFSIFVGSPIVFLVAMVPISVAGWGVREGAFIFVLGLLGISAKIAVLISVTYGVGIALAYFPAIPLLFSRSKIVSGQP